MKFISTPLAPLSSIAEEARALGIPIQGVDARDQLEVLMRAASQLQTAPVFPVAGDGPGNYPKAADVDSTMELGIASER